MLEAELNPVALKGNVTTEPLIDDDSESILIAGGLWLATKLFGSHISGRSPDVGGTML
jgi:hypothetical protein